MKAEQDVDWHARFKTEHSKIPAASGLGWDDVTHFVLLPNYDESVDVLRESLDSIAASSIASTHISVCLAMEQRAKGSKDRAEQLMAEYKDKFKYVMASYHPPKLPGEMPGKASNTKWAAGKVWEYLEQQNIPSEKVVFTVSDSDSEFTPSYFDAVNYRFLTVTLEEQHTSIWQSPMFHYKNYHHQPAIVKLSTMTGCLFYLGGLNESLPRGPRVWTYSTYSLSAHLAKSVGGWDPDWISEDMHMHLKCQLATGGKIRLIPIWLATINYAPQGESYLETIDARFSQGKRHALGFGEVAYFLSNVPAHCGDLTTMDGLKRLLELTGAPGYSLFWDTWTVHAILSLHFCALSINLLTLFTQSSVLSSYLYYGNIALLVLFHLWLAPLAVASVDVYEYIRHRIHPGEGSTFVYDNTMVHYVYVFVSSLVMAVPLYAAACVTEWNAALQIAHTHENEYVVAAKPDQLASPKSSPNGDKKGLKVN